MKISVTQKMLMLLFFVLLAFYLWKLSHSNVPKFERPEASHELIDPAKRENESIPTH